MTLSRLFVIALVAASVAACTSSAEPFKMADGARGYHVMCGGMPWASKDDCLSHADRSCGSAGYTILNQDDPAYHHEESMWSLSTHDITVRCNKIPD
jgi:hypothetical protein